MALASGDIRVELREVKLSDMPQSMLQLSPKATVPVLLTSGGLVVDESLEVMVWSLSIADPQNWLDISEAANQLIQRCDEEFKPLLDCYKYADRHPNLSQAEHRTRAEVFVRELNQLLSLHDYLDDDRCRLPDVAIFPFIRQFAGVDAAWFECCEYSQVRGWLNNMLANPMFPKVMQKYPLWRPGDDAVYL
jgi:glutathione S-transferase